MALSLDSVKKLASLVELRVDPKLGARWTSELRDLAAFVDRLDGGAELGVEGAGEVSAGGEDLPEPCLSRELFLANAPSVHGPFLVVPSVRRGDGDA